MAKHTPLVCQYLEKISRTALEKYQGIIREYVAKRHGVYALYRGNRLYYVGLASNLRIRLRDHLRNRHGQSWDRFSVYLTIGDSHIKELESLVLKIVDPPGNKQAGKFGKAENLKTRFGQAIRKLQRQELGELMGGQKGKTPVKATSTAPKSRKGRLPVLSKYISTPLKLKAKFKNKTVTARVARNGTIRFAGKTYFSPSLAGESSLQPVLQRLDLLELRTRARRLGSFKRVAKVNRGQSDLGSDVRHGQWLSHHMAMKTKSGVTP